MTLIFEIIYMKDKPTLVRLEERFGPFDIRVREDPEDDSEFRFYKKLMEQKPRGGSGGD